MSNAIKKENVVDWKFELQLAKGWILWNEGLIKAIEESDWDALQVYIEQAREDIKEWKKRRTKAFTELGYLFKVKTEAEECEVKTKGER